MAADLHVFATPHSEAPENVPNATTLLSQALEGLSVNERAHAYEDVNGVPRVVSETHALIQNSITNLQSNLMAITQKPAFNQACQQDAAFCCNPAFCLMFLRSESFDCKRAAERMVRHFEVKRKLFGDGLLTTRITLKDLTKEEQQLFAKGGSTQLLPARDAANRMVLFAMEKDHHKVFPKKNAERVTARLIWYYLMALIEDDHESQIHGVVYIAYALGFTPTFTAVDRAVWWNACRICNAVPMRLTGMFYCCEKTVASGLMDVLARGLLNSARCRFQQVRG